MPRSPLDTIEIASPCGEDWDAMKGDDQQRHCQRCDQDVFDLSAMTRAEAEALLREHNGGRLCVKLFRRADGRVLTRDCPVGQATGERRSFLTAGLAGAASLLVGGAAGLFASRGRGLPVVTETMGAMVMPVEHVEQIMGRRVAPADDEHRRAMGQVALPVDAPE